LAAASFSRGGDLNREKLRAIIFSDATRKCALERFSIRGFAANGRTEAEKASQLSEFSLLIFHFSYETGGETLCDRVVVVACSYKVQLARLTQRMSLKTT